MKTLYLRNVPDDVSERLASLAAREGLSVSAFALRELGHVARRADTASLLDDLPDLGVSAKDVVADLEAGAPGSVIVLDASAAVLALLNDGDARRILRTEAAAVPHIADAEVVSALRGQWRRGAVGADDAGVAIGRWAQLGIRRFAAVGLLARVWELRDNLSAYDATYVALAEALGCELLTADARLAHAPGPTCVITVVRG